MEISKNSKQIFKIPAAFINKKLHYRKKAITMRITYSSDPEGTKTMFHLILLLKSSSKQIRCQKPRYVTVKILVTYSSSVEKHVQESYGNMCSHMLQ